MAEAALLRLAEGISRVAAGSTDAPLAAALGYMQAAFASGALPAALFKAWLQSRGDSTAMLSLAWAREQVRLGLRDVLERPGGAGCPADLSIESLAWLLMAACEAIAHELPGAAEDRLGLMLDLARPRSAGDRLRAGS